MSQKPETTFIASVHRHLPAGLYWMKLHNAFNGGPADCWYSGNKFDLWIEYKFLIKLPVRVPILPNCSSLQLQWLDDRYNEGRNIAVIVGCPAGGVVYRKMAWKKPLDPAVFQGRILSRKDIAAWIGYITRG